MNGRPLREREHHDRVVELRDGDCWANVTAAGQARQDRRARMAIQAIPVSEGKRVLEIGCGNGEFSRRFLNTGAEVHCVDISAKLIALLKTKYSGSNLAFEIANVEHLQYPDGYFDGVIGNGVLHHLNLDVCLGEIYRVLREQGRIFLVEPNMLNPEVFLETDVRWIGKFAQKTKDETAFFRWSMKRRLSEIGFKLVEVVPFDFLQPLTPQVLIGVVERTGNILERIPLLREFGGSFRITAEKQ